MAKRSHASASCFVTGPVSDGTFVPHREQATPTAGEYFPRSSLLWIGPTSLHGRSHSKRSVRGTRSKRSRNIEIDFKKVFRTGCYKAVCRVIRSLTSGCRKTLRCSICAVMLPIVEFACMRSFRRQISVAMKLQDRAGRLSVRQLPRRPAHDSKAFSQAAAPCRRYR